jgi:hypothetical protein
MKKSAKRSKAKLTLTTESLRRLTLTSEQLAVVAGGSAPITTSDNSSRSR